MTEDIQLIATADRTVEGHLHANDEVAKGVFPESRYAVFADERGTRILVPIDDVELPEVANDA